MIKLRNKMIGAKVTEEEYHLISIEADRRGQRKSQFFRETLLQCVYAEKLSPSKRKVLTD